MRDRSADLDAVWNEAFAEGYAEGYADGEARGHCDECCAAEGLTRPGDGT